MAAGCTRKHTSIGNTTFVIFRNLQAYWLVLIGALALLNQEPHTLAHAALLHTCTVGSCDKNFHFDLESRRCFAKLHKILLLNSAILDKPLRPPLCLYESFLPTPNHHHELLTKYTRCRPWQSILSPVFKTIGTLHAYLSLLQENKCMLYKFHFIIQVFESLKLKSQVMPWLLLTKNILYVLQQIKYFVCEVEITTQKSLILVLRKFINIYCIKNLEV